VNRKRLIPIVVLVVVIVAVVAVVRSRMPKPLVYSGTVETREIQVGSKIGGRVTGVGVEEGQHVVAGTSLVVFECDELKAQRAQAQATVEQAEADLSRLDKGNRVEEIAQADATLREREDMWNEAKNGPRPQELHEAQAEYRAAQADAINAASNWTRLKTLVDKDTISRQQFDEATAQRDGTAQRAEAAKQKLALLQAGTRTEDLQAAEARYHEAQAADELMHQGFRRQDVDAGKGRLAQAQAHVAELDARIKEANLLAPADGVIETVSVRPGDLIPPSQIVVTMLEKSQLWVKVYAGETDLSHLKVGDDADVTVDSVQRKFNGHVQQIASEAEFLPRNVESRNDREHEVFGVKIAVDDPEGVLKSGMAATVRLR